MPLAIGVDIGGTKVAGGVVDERGAILATARRATPGESAEHALDTVVAVVEELRSAYDVAAVGIAAAGYVSADRTTMLFAPNLPWAGVPVRDHVAARVGLPVTVENDANAAAWAECTYGAAVGESHVVCLTVGTGIGAGLVLDGRLYRGAFGIAGEPGHVCAAGDGQPCGCGNAGCLEQYASGTALARYVRERGGSMAGEEITAAARAGDAVALEAFASVGEWLGQGLADIASMLDPAVFVLGGGVAEAGDLLLAPTVASFRRRLSGAAYRPVADVRLARLGNDAGVVGAADLARA